MAHNACAPMPFESTISGHALSYNPSVTSKHLAGSKQLCISERTHLLEQDLTDGVVGLHDCSPMESSPSAASSEGSSSGIGGLYEFNLGHSLSKQVQNFCHMRGGEEVAVLLTAFRAAQYRFTAAPDIVVGILFANTQDTERSHIIGETIEYVRMSVQRETSFTGLLEQVLEQFAGLSETKDIPLDELLTASFPPEAVPHSQLVKFGFASHDQQPNSALGESAPIFKTQPPSSLTFDIKMQIWRSEKQWYGLLDYDTDLFNHQSIAGLVSTFTDILRSGLAQPHIPISTLELSTGPAYLYDSHFTHLDSTAAAYNESIYDLFWHQVSIRPNSIAVKDAKKTLTFSQLGHLSKLVSNWLSQKHYAVDTIIGVLAPRSVDSLVMYLGILGANHAYLPLDVKSPPNRLSSMLASVGFKPLVLFSTELEPVASGLTGAECTPLSQILDEGRHLTTAEHVLPTPNNLAAVIFTSGSSGIPKGVMIEHHSVVRVAKEKAYQLISSESQAVVAHLLNPAFDAAMMEIYTALLNGHALYCVDESTLLDSSTLVEAFRCENVEMAVFTPALLKQCLRETPEVFATLQILVVGGDRFKTVDAQAVKDLVRGEVFNGYGPTENTVVSTLYRVSSTDESCTDDLPIGTSVAGSVAFVMDFQQRLVPPGVIGELVVAGSGLARGYLDQKLNVNRFVQITVDGKTLRAYRTGDLARLNPEDMQLQFMGRIDQNQQVKIRGHRIELGEIDRTLLRHAAVSESTTITITKDESHDMELVSFVTQAPKGYQTFSPVDSTASAALNDSRIVQFDGIYDDLKHKVNLTALGRDFVGWTSMYDGSVIPTNEMEEWLDDTISTIVRSGRIDTVLEIGTGSGMLLFNLAKRFNRYIGLDLSMPAVDFVNQAIESLSITKNIARVHQGTATDAGHWVHKSQPDLVVVNSVAQYFPSADYLYKVIEKCVEQLHPERCMRLFFGDIRSYALRREFFLRKILQTGVSDQATIVDLHQRASAQEVIEKELLIDPIFFTTLVKHFDGHVEHVEILPKQMKATNELSCYRYAAIIHIKGINAVPLYVHQMDNGFWQDFQQSGLDKLGLQKQLSTLAKDPSLEIILALSNIPHSKTIDERLIAEAYDAESVTETHKLPAISLLAEATRPPSLSSTDLVEIAQSAGLQVEISWARQYSQRGGFDAIFHRSVRSPSGELTRPLFMFPNDNDYRDVCSLCNTPFEENTETALRDQLETWVRTKLPPYMTPTAVIPLEKMPLTNNGKLDHRALAKIAVKELMGEGNSNTASLTAKEAKLQELWAQVLGISASNISVNDHFMRKGGDSIKAMRLIAAARRQGLNLTVVDVMTSPRLRDMAAVMSEQEEKSSAQPTINESVKPFELLQFTGTAEARKLAAIQCQLPETSIEDVLPCTPLQAGLMALNMATPTDYVTRIVKDLDSDVDLDRFRDAFDVLVRNHPILRTRIVDLPQEGFVQVITSEAIFWTLCEDVDNYVQKDQQELMGLGKPLVRVALAKKRTHCPFIWTMHHAIHDGWSVRSLLDTLQRIYHGIAVAPPPPYQSFVKALVAQNRSQAAQTAWLASLNGHEADPFPRLPFPDYKPRADSALVYKVENLSWDTMDVTAAVAIRATWGILVYSRENVQDVIFGTTVSGRDSVAVPGIEEMTGPTIATIPTRMQLSSQDETLGDLVVRLQREWTSLTPYEHVGLQHIRELSEDAARAVAFQTLLVVQPAEKKRGTGEERSLFKAEAEIHAADNDIGALSTYAMVVEFQLQDHGLNIRVTFDSHVLSEGQVRRMFSQYESILRRLCKQDTRRKRLSEIEWLSDWDMHDIWMWNDKMPDVVDSTVHDLLASNFANHPEAEAICAWDGSFTYAMLDEESSRLAHKLLNGRPIDAAPVPILFKKSKWVSVAMLAVMKAGGTSVLLDATLPAARLQDIIDQLCPNIMLISTEEQILASSIFNGELVVVGSAQETESSTQLPETKLPVVSSDTPLYIVFTSGSTGKPKGCVISHRSFSSAIVYQYPRRSISSQSRVFDFSSLAFDGTWFNLLHTLYAGGTVCVPSECGRKDDLKGSILQLRATFAFLTPTVAETLDAETLESLESLEIGGEAMDLEVMRRIQSHTHVRYIYGPSECTPICSLTEIDSHPSSLGHAAGVLTWLVDPQQSDRLASIGSVAELWLEGPLVGSGYYKDPMRTSAAFVVDPSWMTRDRPGQPGRTGRAYRTGDLVRYQDDGTLEFIRRTTTQQVKIRGQRVELGDVQHHVRQILRKKDPDVQVIADVTGEDGKILVAFVWSPKKTWSDASFESRIQILKEMAGNIKKDLAGVVPSYMVPALFVPVAEIPMTVSGKMDRRKLQAILLDLDTKQRDACLLNLHENTSSPARPMTSMEKQLASLWASALRIPEDGIGINDNFFNRGGDSISAMRLVNAARKHEVVMSVKNIWDHPQLKGLAAHLAQSQTGDKLPRTSHELTKSATSFNRSPVSGPLPVTYTQRLFLTGSIGGYFAHIYHLLIDLPAEMKPSQVRRSCQKLFQHFDILRARFACTSQRTWQYLDAEDSALPWEAVSTNEKEDLESTTRRICSKTQNALRIQYPNGQSNSTRFIFVQSSQHNVSSRLILRLSHAQYDGISLPRMLSTLSDFLQERSSLAPAPKYADYIQYIFSQDPTPSYAYWRNLLHGTSSPTVIPACDIPDMATDKVSLLKVNRTIQVPAVQGIGETHYHTTPAVRFMASCAAMFAQVTQSNDVVFGCMVSGRNALPASLREVCGPCLNEIPLRVTFPSPSPTSPTISAKSVYTQILTQLLHSSSYDTTPFDEIATHCTSWPPSVEDFGLSAHFQNTASEGGEKVDGLEYSWFEAEREEDGMAVPKAGYVEVEGTPMGDGRVNISVIARSDVYTREFLEGLLGMVCEGLEGE